MGKEHESVWSEITVTSLRQCVLPTGLLREVYFHTCRHHKDSTESY